MPHGHLLRETAGRERIRRGATAVRVTLGPRSKCLVEARRRGKPLICNDGVTIAKEVDLEDPEENLGVQVRREAAERTGEAVSDGTTTAPLLAHAMFADGVRIVAAGASAIDLKRGMERGLKATVEAIRGISRPVTTAWKWVQVSRSRAAAAQHPRVHLPVTRAPRP